MSEESEVVEVSPDNVGDMTMEDKREALASLMNSTPEEAAEMEDVQEAPEEVISLDDAPEQVSDLDQLRQENERLKQQLTEENKRHDRMGTKLGEQRKFLENAINEVQQSLNEHQENASTDILNDPIGVMQKQQELQQQQARLERQRDAVAQQQTQAMTKNQVAQYVENHEQLLEHLPSILEEDGVSAEQAKAMDIFSMPAPVAVNLLKRAKMRQELEQAQQEIARLRGGSRNVLQNIDKAAKNGRVNGRSGNSAGDARTFSREDIKSMSSSEKRDLLAKLQKQYIQSQ